MTQIRDDHRDIARAITQRRATQGNYAGDVEEIAQALADIEAGARGTASAQLSAIADKLDVYSIRHLKTENKFALHGAYDSAAEMAAWKHGVRAAADFIRAMVLPGEGEGS